MSNIFYVFNTSCHQMKYVGFFCNVSRAEFIAPTEELHNLVFSEASQRCLPKGSIHLKPCLEINWTQHKDLAKIH